MRTQIPEHTQRYPTLTFELIQFCNQNRAAASNLELQAQTGHVCGRAQLGYRPNRNKPHDVRNLHKHPNLGQDRSCVPSYAPNMKKSQRALIFNNHTQAQTIHLITFPKQQTFSRSSFPEVDSISESHYCMREERLMWLTVLRASRSAHMVSFQLFSASSSTSFSAIRTWSFAISSVALDSLYREVEASSSRASARECATSRHFDSPASLASHACNVEFNYQIEVTSNGFAVICFWSAYTVRNTPFTSDASLSKLLEATMSKQPLTQNTRTTSRVHNTYPSECGSLRAVTSVSAGLSYRKI